MAVANSYLVIRANFHYQGFREKIPEGHLYQGDMMGAFDGLLGSVLGGSPDTHTASVQLLVRYVQQDAMIRAFNEITAVIAIVIALSLLLMPLVRSVRRAQQSSD